MLKSCFLCAEHRHFHSLENNKIWFAAFSEYRIECQPSNGSEPDAKISAINVFTCWQSFRYRLFRLCSGWNFFLPLSLAPITDKSKKESPPKWCCRTIVFREIKHWLPAKCGKFYAHNWIEWTARVSNFSYILINFKSRSIDQIKRQME